MHVYNSCVGLFNEFISRIIDENSRDRVSAGGCLRCAGSRRVWRCCHAEYPNILIGPLVDEQYQYLKSVTFFVNPDQLALMMLGAQYFHAPGDTFRVAVS